MIRANFQKDTQGLREVSVSGHAGYAESGFDIVCASVTSAVQLCANGITQVLNIPAEVTALDNQVLIRLPGDSGEGAAAFLEALNLHLQLLAEDYPKYIKLTITEVQDKC